MAEVRWNGPDWKKRVEKVGFRGVIECGLAISAQAKALSPYITNRLRDSITVQWRGGGTAPDAAAKAGDTIGTPEAGTVAVGTNVEYAPYVEYGTSRSMAQPYLRPAIDLVRGKAVQIVEREGKREFTGYDD